MSPPPYQVPAENENSGPNASDSVPRVGDLEFIAGEEPVLQVLPFDMNNKIGDVAITIAKNIVECCASQICKFFYFVSLIV